MAMLRMTTTRGQKAEVVIPTPHYTPSTPSPRHRYIIHHNTCHLRYRCLTPACIKKTHAHCEKIQYLNSSQLAVSTTPKPYTPPKRTHLSAQFATPTRPTSAVMHVPAEPQHLPPTPDTSRLQIQYPVVSIPIV